MYCVHVLEGRKAPDHSTIDRFIRMNGEAIRNVLAQSAKKLDGLGELKREIAFIDGTKVESKAGKYTFIWPKAESSGTTVYHIASYLSGKKDITVLTNSIRVV